MREDARGRTIELSAPDGRRTVLGAEAIEALRHAGLREAEAVQRVLASEVVEMPRAEPAKPAAVPSRTFFGRADERRFLEEWLASGSRAVAVVIGVAGVRQTPPPAPAPPAGSPAKTPPPREPPHPAPRPAGSAADLPPPPNP